MISGDEKVLDPNSAVSKRLALQRAQVDALDIFVWPQVHSRLDIWRAALRNQYDVVTAQDPFWRGLLAWRVARRSGVRLNLQVHTDLSAQPFFRRRLAYFLLRRADSVRVVSEKIKKQVEQVGIRARVDVLPIFVDIEQFQKIERKSHEGKVILWVGRFEDEKDPSAAIVILKKIQEEGAAVRLVMLGSGSQEQSLREEARGLPVEFPGWKDAKPYLEIADVVLSTSKHESWGASIIEALASGIPVVSPDVGIARDAGAIVVPKEKFSEAVIEALNLEKRGELKLKMPNKEEWAKQWEETLI